MGSRLLTLLALQGCLLDQRLYQEKRQELLAAEAADEDLDGDGFDADVDCDDLDPDVHPGAGEIAYDGVDNDCDPTSLDDDGDRDGHGADDCDDTDPSVHPGVPEDYYNGVDDDCDPSTVDDDQDGDGVPVGADCADTDPDRSPALDEVPYNGIDDDCDPTTRDDDLDGDGALAANDCDDRNPDVSPAEDEIPYNGVDDDCAPWTPDDDLDGDGAPLADDCDDDDDSKQLVVSYHEDLDLDGYGGAVAATGCADEDHPDTVLLGGDCDDGNRRRNPETVWVIDVDGDGFGAVASTVACDPGPGWALAAGDCDDADASVFPGAIDAVCGDGLSPSCAADLPCRAPLVGDVSTLDPGSVLHFGGDTASAFGGGADLDGDGWPDAWIGADDDRGGTSPGIVYLLTGPLTDGLVDPDSAWGTVAGEQIADRFGAAVSAAGDLDGDGYDDLLIGAPGLVPATGPGAGAVYLVFGPLDAVTYVSNAANVVRVENSTPEEGLGATVAAAGDTNGDGYGDWLATSTSGKAWLSLGRPAGFADGTIVDHRHLVLDSTEPVGEVLGSLDHDGDGLSDLLLSAPGHARASDGAVAGAAWLLAGADLPDAPGSTATPADLGLVLEGSLPGDASGAAVCGGDINGDGYGDAVVGSPGANSGAGRISVWYGSSAPIGTAVVPLATAASAVDGAPAEALGSALACLPDGALAAFGDGFGAVLTAVPFGTSALADQERARLFGVSTGTSTDDLDRDGRPDLALPAADGADLLFVDLGGL